MQSKKHNGIISFWKFMFAMMIVIFHSKIFRKNSEGIILKYGYIAVEFFFIVAGYFMTRRALSKKEDCSNIGKETIGYIWNKIKTIFPYVLIAFIIEFVFNLVTGKHTLQQLISSIWQLLFLETTGVQSVKIIVPIWYISAMLISMFVLYPLIRKYKKNFILLVLPLVVMFVGGWLSHVYGNLNLTTKRWTGIFCAGLLRGFFELSLGSILYLVVEKIKSINLSKFYRCILTLIEIWGFISVFVVANFYKQYDFILLLILAMSISIALSEETLFFNLSDNRLCKYLGELSLVMYINHPWIIDIIKYNFGSLRYIYKLLLLLICTLIVSVIIKFISDKICKKNVVS